MQSIFFGTLLPMYPYCIVNATIYYKLIELTYSNITYIRYTVISHDFRSKLKYINMTMQSMFFRTLYLSTHTVK